VVVGVRELLRQRLVPGDLRGLACLTLALGRGLMDDLRGLGFVIPVVLSSRLAALCPELHFDAQSGFFETTESLPAVFDDDVLDALLICERAGERHDLSDQERGFERLSVLADYLVEQDERQEQERGLFLLRLSRQLLMANWNCSAQVHAAMAEAAKPGANDLPYQAAVPLLRVRLFGDMEVEYGGQLLQDTDLRRGQLRTFFSLLVLNQGKGLSRDTLISWLWPDKEYGRGLKSFYNLWSRLCNSFPGTNGGCPYASNSQRLIRIDPRFVSSDVSEFECLARQLLFEMGSPEERLAAVDRVEQIYRSDILAGCRIHPRVEAAQNRYRSMMLDVLFMASQLHLEQGNASMALWYARRAFDVDAGSEEGYRILMASQEAAGKRTSALRTYFDCKQYLDEELGILPSQQTTALYQGLILDGQ